MAKIQVTRTVPERKEQVTIKLKCDGCGKDSPLSDNWLNHPTKIIRITMEKRHGWCDHINDTGCHELIEYDICPDCFDKIATAFNFGEPTITEYDF